GGIYSINGADPADKMIVTGCTLNGNSALRGGGGIYTFGVATVANSTLSNNSAGFGGAIVLGSVFAFGTHTLTLTSTVLNANHASANGGAIYNFNASILSGCTLTDNSTTSGDGGGVYNAGTVTVDGSTLTGNSAVNGGGIASDRSLTVSGS